MFSFLKLTRRTDEKKRVTGGEFHPVRHVEDVQGPVGPAERTLDCTVRQVDPNAVVAV